MNRRELKERLGVVETRLNWLITQKPPAEGKNHIIKENDVWTIGVTEHADGSFSSVWMAVKGD